MRAYIAVVLLTAGLVVPAVAETAQLPVNVQQPEKERTAQRHKAYRRAVAARTAQANQPPEEKAKQLRAPENSGPTRIIPATAATTSARPASWSSSLLGWWRGESTPAGAGEATAEISAEPAAARVDPTPVTAEPVKTTRRKARRTRRPEPTATATGAVPETTQAEAKEEKPIRSKRRSARRSKSRVHQVASRSSTSRQTDRNGSGSPPEPRPKPENHPKGKAQPATADDEAAVGSISQAEPTAGAQHLAALSSDQDNAGAEATWWQSQGNPVVFNFRDCVASYASREAGHKDGTWADLLIRATESDCRAPFDEMARTLARRFGEARIEPVMRKLIDTTFLPAAKQAAASGTPSSGIPPLEPVPDSTPSQ